MRNQRCKDRYLHTGREEGVNGGAAFEWSLGILYGEKGRFTEKTTGAKTVLDSIMIGGNDIGRNRNAYRPELETWSGFAHTELALNRC